MFLQSNKISGSDYELEDNCRENLGKDHDENVTKKAVEFEHVQEVIQANLKGAYERSKSKYDMRKRIVKFNVGETVFKKNFLKSDRRKNLTQKFCPRFIKCKIKAVLGQNVYELADYLTGKSLGNFHAKDIIKA